LLHNVIQFDVAKTLNLFATRLLSEGGM